VLAIVNILPVRRDLLYERPGIKHRLKENIGA
jgi:hypothetical protein